MTVLAFVDYDNVRSIPDRTLADVTLNLEELCDRLSRTVRRALPGTEEIELRLYGGWVSEDGRFSRNAEWLLSAIADVRGRWHGIRLKPSMITRLACWPHANLIGTLRLRSQPVRQKMVDGLLTVDAIHLAQESVAPLLIVSDDDDMVPCAVAVSRLVKGPLVLLRRRRPGDGLNDEILGTLGVQLDVVR
jgi:hypothetical protein